MIESLCRIITVTIVGIVWLSMIVFPARNALAWDDDDKPKPTPTSVSPATATPDRRQEYLWGAAAVSGIATAALRTTEHGALWAFGGTVATAAAVEAAQSGAYNGTNVWWAAGGALLGTVGTCKLLLDKKFVGCAVSFK